MTADSEFTDRHTSTSANERALALLQARVLAGDPKDYRLTSKRETKGEPRPAEGVLGAFGVTAPAGTETTDTTSTDYPSALIALADYIHTGRRHEDDEQPEEGSGDVAEPEDGEQS